MPKFAPSDVAVKMVFPLTVVPSAELKKHWSQNLRHPTRSTPDPEVVTLASPTTFDPLQDQ